MIANYTQKQKRYYLLLKEADTLFSIGWLRKILKDDSQLHTEKERLFAEAVFNPDPAVMEAIEDTIDPTLGGLTPFELLEELREKGIEDFVTGIKTASTWHTVEASNEDSWRDFVQRIRFGVQEWEEDIRKFFTTFSLICTITDILTGHGSEYGIDLDDACRKEFLRQREMRMEGVVLKNDSGNVPEFEMKELKFFDMRVFDTAKKQFELSKALRESALKIDRKNGREWFGHYAAYRYATRDTGTNGGYVAFFSDIEILIPDMLQVDNRDAKGDARYSKYTKGLGKEVMNWYVDEGHLPPINNLTFMTYRFGCRKNVFDKRKPIIQELYRWFNDHK